MALVFPESALLREIGDVVRKGHVRRIERNRIVCDGGSVPNLVRLLR